MSYVSHSNNVNTWKQMPEKSADILTYISYEGVSPIAHDSCYLLKHVRLGF